MLYTLTFWLLLRQFVKEKLLKRKKVPSALMEVTVADTGERTGPLGSAPSCLVPKSHPHAPAWPAEPTRTRTLFRSLGELVTGIYAKYWIYVCAGMFIVVSFAGRLVVYKIVYMFLFLLCLTLFQVSGADRLGPSCGRASPRGALTHLSLQVYYSLWRKLLKMFWWLVVAYTMLVLIAVYTFQFQDFPMYWRNLTGFTDEQ